MGKSSVSLTKICNSCGQQRPLSAFLQLTGPQGTTYGNTCAPCRKANLEKPQSPKEPEEKTSSTTGVKIDSKTKVKGEIDKRAQRKQIEDQYFKDREKQSEKQTQQTQKIQHVAQGEKKHRSFLEKRSFLDSAKKPASTNPHHVFGGEEQKAKAGKLDFATGPVDHTRVAGQIKLTSPIYQAFKSWLGNAPIVSAAEKAAQQNNNTPNAESDALNDYVNKTLGPNSRK